MGCFQSKKEITNQHANLFRVVNIDENGADLCSGQLEITDSEIILYREGRGSVIWPLHCLRRFGFDGELFSFEAGRRCETGEGIYGFKCRRASLLFRILHQRIYQRNIDRDTLPRLSPPGRQAIQASVIHRSSVDNGPPNNTMSNVNNTPLNVAINALGQQVLQAPPSPSSADILEVMPLYPRSQPSSSQVTNIYQVKDFKREHNNNQSEAGSGGHHSYSNDLNRDLAILRHALKQEAAINTIRDIEEETRYLQNRCLDVSATSVAKNTINSPISPTLSNISEQYAKLNVEHPDARLYVNVARNECSFYDGRQNDTVPTTPLTPKQVEYCNLTIGIKQEPNTYANLMLGELSEKSKSCKHLYNLSDRNQKFSESDTFTSISPVEELEVNYAVLDIDPNNEVLKATKEIMSPDSQSITSKNGSVGSNSSRARHLVVTHSHSFYDIDQVLSLASTSQAANIGYTSIDFAATSALSSVVANAEIFICEDGRTHRHNSCTISIGSPGSSDKSKGNN